MLVLGHRGVNIKSGSVSENSLPAFQMALAAADGFETDACLSRDGEIFLIHDPAAIAGLPAAEVEKRRLKNGETIPTLRQALALVGSQAGRFINIELKGPGTAEPVINLLRQSFAAKLIEPRAIIMSSFDHALLLAVRKAMPALKIDALFDDGPRVSAPLDDIRPDFLVMPEKSLTPENAALAARLYPYARLCGWTVSERDDYDEADLLRRLRILPPALVGAMIVDDPAAFAAALRHAKLRP